MKTAPMVLAMLILTALMPMGGNAFAAEHKGQKSEASDAGSL